MKTPFAEVWDNPMKGAVERLSKAVEVDTDLELAKYNKMKDKDFMEMASKVGMDKTSAYIKKMELRRAGRK